MFKNHLKIAWRNLIRNKSFSLLNIVGLAIGLAVTTLIILWIDYEVKFDQYHTNIDRIYEVNNQFPVEGEIWTWNSTPKAMAKAIKKDYPEVESVSRYFYDTAFLFSKDETRINATGTVVDPEFLNIFSFPLVKGDKENVLSDVNSVVITEAFAKKLFGDKDPIGQMVKIDNADTFKVTGVLKDLPPNTDFSFEFLVPWAYITQKGWDDNHWGNNSVATYVMLKPNTDFNSFAAKIKTLRKNYDKDSPEMETLLYPYSRTYLYSEFENGKEVGGRIVLIRMFGIIAFIILIIACINFMNLSTAQSEKRAKEVGIRKVIGAERGALILQFLREATLISFISAVLAFIIVLLALPAFNELIDRPLTLDLTNKWFWISAIGIILFTGFLAGSYPAIFLSSFKPSAVLKGVFKKGNTLITPRKALVVLQFSAAIVLITATIIISKQLNKVQNREMGYAKDNLIYTMMEGDIKKNFELIKTDLLASGNVTSVTKNSSPITESWSNTWGMEWKGKKENDKTLVLRMIADEGITKTMSLELIEGRDMDLQKFPTDSTAAIINESAVALMGFKNPIGETINDNGVKWNVIGVVKDFVFNSPFQKIEPLVIEGAKGWFNVVHIKMNAAKTTSENLASVESIYKKYNPEYPFNFEFVDAQYAKKFKDQQRTSKLAWLSTILIIFISCLGLFGLSSYMAENRIKEIGIRKVLGASVTSITTLLSKEFLKLIGVALLIAIPISWFFMNKWLEDFAYRITISWEIFLIAGILTLVIALVTVSFQAVKAALSNPVKSLKQQ